MNDRTIKQLSDIPETRDVVLYGAGRGGRRFLQLLRTFRPAMTVRHFLTSTDEGQGEVEGLPVVPLEVFKKNVSKLVSQSSYLAPTILITSFYWREIAETLETNGFTDFLVVPTWFFYPPDYNRRLTQDERIKLAPQLNRIHALLETPDDRELYHILTGQSKHFPSSFDAITHYFYRHSSNRQYFDFIRYDRIHTMVEGGVFDGGNTLSFSGKINPGGKIYGFEPNYKNFRQGPHYEKLKTLSSVQILPQGLWSRSQQILLSDSKDASKILTGESGAFSQTSTESNTQEPASNIITIDAVSIDDFVKERNIQKIDFIKLDVEGAELDVLKGAANVLKTHRPQLAISIYHKRDDVYTIPLFLAETLKNYTFRLGHYSPGFCESIWYAIPAEIYKDTN